MIVTGGESLPNKLIGGSEMATKTNSVKGTTKKPVATKEVETNKVDAQNVDLAEVSKSLEEATEFEVKHYYGKGGQTYAAYPILLDPKENPFTQEIKNSIPSRNKNTENGSILRVEVLAGGIPYYMVVLVANKSTNFEEWELEWGTGESFLQYTKFNKIKDIELTNENIFIPNIVTNGSKARDQAKALARKLNMEYKVYDNHFVLEAEGVLAEIGKNSGRATGKKFNSIEELFSRKLLNAEWTKFYKVIR